MSEQEIYEIARQRIDRRNRRWSIWSVNLGVLILTLAALILTGSTTAAAVFMAWAAVFTVHTIIAGLAESREGSIENEVAKLRSLVAATDRYEKPKNRLTLTDDGEVLESEETNEAQRVRVRGGR